jgi:RND family efflux transporter MFP subunit
MQTSSAVIIQPEIEPPQHQGRSKRTGVLAGVLVAFLILFAIGLVPRLTRQSQAQELANEHKTQIPAVITVPVRPAGATSELSLPGNIEAVYVASIYARANGYVKRRLVDIGQRVHAGDLLAEIDAPEINQQLAQARAALGQTRAAYEEARANLKESEASVTQAKANLDQAQANEAIAKTTDSRWSRLVDRGVLPKQQGDERRSAYHARVAEVAAAEANIQTAEATVRSRRASVDSAQANIAAARAEVGRLQEMVSFERVLAPFDGVITERRVERGDFVGAGGAGGQSRLFSIAQSNILRIQTQVPQAYASGIKDGEQAEITVRGGGQQVVTGKVVRSANALNAQTRTLLVEVQIDNRSGALLPGMYADVKFVLPRTKNLVVVPADTLVVNGSGTHVIAVGADSRAHSIPVEVGRDLGSEIEILSGLDGSEQLVSNPTDDITDGRQVQARASAPAQGKS